MRSGSELVSGYQKTKNDIKRSVQAGAQFILGCMADGKVPSYSPHSKRFGLWPAAEMANFLLLNNIMPKTCSNRIDPIIDFLISKFKSFSDGTGAWYATVNGTREYYSTQTTGYCAYVLKLYYNEFLDDERRNVIKDIIVRSEKYIISKQQDGGFWSPGTAVNDASTNGINYADFFYSYYSYFGIKELSTYEREGSTIIERALEKSKNYFYKFAQSLVQSYEASSMTDSAKAVLLSNISKVLQILNDFKDEYLADVISTLHRMSLEIFDVVNNNNFVCSSVTLDRLDADSQRTYHNNTPFDVYFSLREEKISAENIIKVVTWYLEHQDTTGCWYLDADPNTKQSTWTTIEALLVLSDAYDMLSEEFYLRELHSFDKLQQECNSNKEAIETEKTALLEQYGLEKQKFISNIKKIRKRSNILLGVSVGISIAFSIVCLVLFICVVTMEMNSTLKTFIDVLIFSLAGNALFQAATFIVQIAKKRVKELEDSYGKDS